MSQFFSSHHLTPAATRVVQQCRQLASGHSASDAWAGHLILTLLMDESLASAALRKSGVTLEWLISGGLGNEVASSAVECQYAEFSGDHDDYDSPEPMDFEPFACSSVAALELGEAPEQFTRILERAVALCRRSGPEEGVSSWHLLAAVTEVSDFVRERFQQAGAELPVMSQDSSSFTAERLPQLEVQCSLRLSPDSIPESIPLKGSKIPVVPDALVIQQEPAATISSQSLGEVWRVIDANLNRAREGLRVLEDYARFMAGDASCCEALKRLRHALVSAERQYLTQITGYEASHAAAPLSGRDTQHDVGTGITTESELSRHSIRDIRAANCRRVQEALRSLEEFSKVVSPEFSAVAKQLRYRSYELEQQLELRQQPSQSSADRRRTRLQAAVLYVLITEELLQRPWKHFVEQVIAGGADVLQLREKHLNDRELIRRARWLAAFCREADTLFIVNDRPDVATLSDADGVHVGQDETLPADARRIIGNDRLLGISTHDLSQVDEAVTCGADYLGVGPVFAGRTKKFDHFPGLDFVKQVVARRLAVPWFAIGGINGDNLNRLTSVGVHRVAVTGALAEADDPAAAAAVLRVCLASRGPS